MGLLCHCFSISLSPRCQRRPTVQLILELTAEEKEMLKELSSSELSELRFEIADTDRKDFRDMLKRKEVLLKRIIEQLNE